MQQKELRLNYDSTTFCHGTAKKNKVAPGLANKTKTCLLIARGAWEPVPARNPGGKIALIQRFKAEDAH